MVFGAIAGLAIGLTAAPAAAVTVLTVDLTVENQIKIAATDGASANTVSGSVFFGVYLRELLRTDFKGEIFTNLDDAIGDGDLAKFTETPSRVPRISFATEFLPGINVFGFNAPPFDPNVPPIVEFTPDNQAFKGSATWNVTEAFYRAALEGPSNGDVVFPVDEPSDLTSAALIGQWQKITQNSATPVPLPASVLFLASALVGLGAVGARRKRA
ncbi:MAG: VPLPA-CTERM sorting domain-containing protein [Neomegalonema sp.]